ncbi:SufE family protein [Pedobacter gandavensis]|uniref:SufE family protein n=1 Tax=Pedobacter gandavensis TaxID=2679963 RepID=UPI00292ECCA8|nr:SufE family protein [Pedobacter gandavensis]
MNQKSIAEIEKEIISDFSMFDSWEDKYEYLIDLGKQLPALEESYKTTDHKIKGCQSSVWLIASYQDGKVFFKADSDAMIVKGLVSMLIKVLSGQSPKAILEGKLEFFKEIGMFSHLAQTRSNGLLAMIKQIKNYALAYQSIQQTENK